MAAHGASVVERGAPKDSVAQIELGGDDFWDLLPSRLLEPETSFGVCDKAVRNAAIETDLDRHLFPVDCPSRRAEILGEDWLPGD